MRFSSVSAERRVLLRGKKFLMDSYGQAGMWSGSDERGPAQGQPYCACVQEIGCKGHVRVCEGDRGAEQEGQVESSVSVCEVVSVDVIRPGKDLRPIHPLLYSHGCGLTNPSSGPPRHTPGMAHDCMDTMSLGAPQGAVFDMYVCSLPPRVHTRLVARRQAAAVLVDAHENKTPTHRSYNRIGGQQIAHCQRRAVDGALWGVAQCTTYALKAERMGASPCRGRIHERRSTLLSVGWRTVSRISVPANATCLTNAVQYIP